MSRWMCVVLLACGQADPVPEPAEPEPAESEEAEQTDVAEPSEIGPRPERWVSERVQEASTRLQADPAGRLVWDAIEAHGGLQAWHTQSTLEFEFDYKSLTQPDKHMHTLNAIDVWSSRARQVEVGGDATMGWDGAEAWITPNADAFPLPARFWALTPYYFVAMPFVAADPGTNYERLEDAELDGVVHQLVKLTYGEGVGDAPDDYYILYLHPETKRLSALRYVVSYPGFFPDGGHTPEKLMRYSEYAQTDGVWLAGRLNTSSWGEEGAGDVVTEITVTNIQLGRRWAEDFFARPQGAELSALD